MEKFFAVGPEIQIDVPVMKHVPRGANIVKFHIRAGGPEVRQHALGQAGTPVLLAENLDRNALRHAPQQIERLYIQIVIYNQYRLFSHAVNLRVGDVGLQALPVQNQKMFESARVDEICHDFLQVQVHLSEIFTHIILYCALKNFSKSAYNAQKVKKFEQELKPLATCKTVANSDIQKAQKCPAIQNPLFAQYKKVLKYAEIILKRNGLRYDSKSSNSEIRGFLVDVSELWEIYLEKILQDNFPDWNVNGQYEMPVYKGSTFFGRDFYPDLVLEKDDQYAVFDAKFKAMNGIRSDVDRNDLHQIHMYAGHFAKMGNLIAAGLLYPCSKTPNEKWNAELNTYTSKPSKFVIDGVNVEKIQQDDLSYTEAFEMLEEEERLFVERIRNCIECDI